MAQGRDPDAATPAEQNPQLSPTSQPPGSPDSPEATRPSDHDLVAAHLAGDPDAFAEMIGRHRDRLWRVALRMMRDPHDAADALQDAYLSAFRRVGTFRGEAQVTTWLHRVVVNACLDRLRRQQTRSREQPLPEYPDRAAVLGTEATPDPVEVQEARLDIETALSQLGTDQRAALILVDMEGYSVDEAAAILGCAPGTVKSRCARGRARLLPLLAHLGDPEEDPAPVRVRDRTAGQAGG